MKGFVVSAEMTKASAMRDFGMSVGFHTRELDPEAKVQIMNMHNQTGWLLFSPDEIQESEVPDKPSDIETKTPSQRLRGAIFVYWQQQGSQGEFEQFYKQKMEAFIEHVKSKLI